MNYLENAALSRKRKGFDLLILSTTSETNAQFWEERLSESLNNFFDAPPKIVAIVEDWEKGAGNGLGTLYAYQAANRRERIDQLLDENASIAIYHTAGQGKRLAPLSLSERSKGSVKLPYQIDGVGALTILEAAIVQSSLFAPSRKGRVSVFWGDQVFIPSRPIDQAPESHVDILAQFVPVPDEKAWKEKHCGQYGILTKDPKGDCRLLEKVDYPSLKSHAKKYGIDPAKGIGLSLGCFSLSKELLRGMIQEFQTELTQKKGKLDSDPHFWVPATHDQSDCAHNQDELKHYRRMKKLFSRFNDKLLFHATDIGEKSFWWDFGTVQCYYQNLLKLTENSEEGKAVRTFFDAELDESGNLILESDLKENRLKRSVVFAVKGDRAQGENAVLIDVESPEVIGSNALAYGVNTDTTVHLEEEEVFVHTPHIPLHTFLDRNGKEDWEVALEGNPASYAEIKSSGKPEPSSINLKGSF